MSNIIYVYSNEEKVVTQAEIHSQPESHSQEPQPEAQESHIQESQTQLEKYSLTLNQAINYRNTGGITDVMDMYNWHTCSDICKTLDFDNLYYKYLHQDVCPLRQSNWTFKTSGDIADWEAAVVT